MAFVDVGSPYRIGNTSGLESQATILTLLLPQTLPVLVPLCGSEQGIPSGPDMGVSLICS